MSSTRPQVAVGQVWVAADPRLGASAPRQFIEIESIDGGYARVRRYRTHITADRRTHKEYSSRTTRIRLDRFRPTSTGYRRVS